MKKKNQLDPCPMCGNRRKPRTTASLGKSALKTAGPSGVSGPAESSDDRTANDFAALLLAGRTSQP